VKHDISKMKISQ